MTVNLGRGLGGRWLEGGGETGRLLMGRGKGKSSQTERRPAESSGKGEEVGEGSSDTDMGIGDASAMTGMPLVAEHHSRVVPPTSAHALVQPGGLQRHLRAFSKPISIQPRGSIIPSEWRSRFAALGSSLPPPVSHPPPKPEERAGRHQRLRIWLPAANKTYLCLPSRSPCPLSGGGWTRKTPLALPEHRRVAAHRDRVTRWTAGSRHSLLCGSLVPPS